MKEEIMEEENDSVMTIKMPSKVKNWYKIMGKKEGRMMSNYALLVLKNHMIETEKEKNKKN